MDKKLLDTARSRRTFLRKAFASMALGATGALTMPGTLQARSPEEEGTFQEMIRKKSVSLNWKPSR
jgi:hypothetical protein